MAILGENSYQPSRVWGETRPGERYPQVEEPGNPSWEARNPKPTYSTNRYLPITSYRESLTQTPLQRPLPINLPREELISNQQPYNPTGLSPGKYAGMSPYQQSMYQLNPATGLYDPIQRRQPLNNYLAQQQPTQNLARLAQLIQGLQGRKPYAGFMPQNNYLAQLMQILGRGL